MKSKKSSEPICASYVRTSDASIARATSYDTGCGYLLYKCDTNDTNDTKIRQFVRAAVRDGDVTINNCQPAQNQNPKPKQLTSPTRELQEKKHGKKYEKYENYENETADLQ